MQWIVAAHHRADLGNSCILEFFAQRAEQGLADPFLAVFGIDRNREYPTAGFGAEFPDAYLSDDQSKNRGWFDITCMVGNKEETLIQPP